MVIVQQFNIFSTSIVFLKNHYNCLGCVNSNTLIIAICIKVVQLKLETFFGIREQTVSSANKSKSVFNIYNIKWTVFSEGIHVINKTDEQERRQGLSLFHAHEAVKICWVNIIWGVLTHDVTLLYIACNILTILHEPPIFNILNHIPFRYTRSNAFWKSTKVQYNFFFAWLITLSIIDDNTKIQSKVL